MLTIASIDRFDTINNPGDEEPSVTVWFSGCTAGCPDCHNPRLHNKNAGTEYMAETVLYSLCYQCKHIGTKTIVLLGGEPLEQDHNDLLTLVSKLKSDGYKIWLYTGWEFDKIPARIRDCMHTIKCGKYVKELAQQGFPSSSNQKIYRNGPDGWNAINITTLGG